MNDSREVDSLLAAVSGAILQISQARGLPETLQRIVDVSRELLAADFAGLTAAELENLPDYFVFSGMERATAERIFAPSTAVTLFSTLGDEQETIRLTEVAQHPAFKDLPSDYPIMGSVLGMVIRHEGRVYGRICLAKAASKSTFTAEDEALLTLFVPHAAVAIQNALLTAASHGQRQQLQERNRQLAALDKATMAIASELSIDKVLQQIVDAARELGDAQYAALGVPNSQGFLDAFIDSGMEPEVVAGIPHLPTGLGLLGAIIKERKTIRIPRITDDPRSVGFPEGHPPMDPFLGVPVIAGGEALGNLYLTNKLGADEFTAMDQDLVEILAAHAAVAIQNARLYEEVGRLAIVEERTRIGMDLHDGIIQSVFAVGLTLESARLTLQQHPEEADKLLSHAIEALNGTIRDIRNFILDLRPHRFQGNLEQGLGRLVREFQANTMVAVSLSIDKNVLKLLPPHVARSLFLTTQEALANIARHAQAQQVLINIGLEDKQIVLRVSDDGRGFDMAAKNYSVGHGLSNMRARAEVLNGSFDIQSELGKGTMIRLTIPV